MRFLHVTLFILFLSVGTGHSTLFAQERKPSVTAELSQASVTFGDYVSLTVTARNMDEALDLSSLNAQFNVIGRSSSREVNIINGVQNVLVNWVVRIEPKVPGVLTVPPISVGNLQTQPLALNVSSPPTGASRVLFIEASVDTENPYVQSQVLLTIKVWQAVRVFESNIVNLGSNQFQTVPLERDREYVDTRDGKEFLVLEQQFALFPHTSGVHIFGPIELRAKIPVDNSQVQGFFTPTRSVKRLSQPITLNVKARPDSVQGQWWLPAQDVQITDSWSADPANINANDTITRTIQVTATGVSGDQLPDIEPPIVDGLKLYADNIDRSSVATDQGIVSTQTITWAVLPERNGAVEVPPIKMGWFNTENGQSEVAELPAQTVVVSGIVDAQDNNLVGPASDTLVASNRYPNWLWLVFGAVALLGLQALAFGLWKLRSLRMNSKRTVSVNHADAARIPSLRQVSSAAKSAKLPAFQEAVMQWAQEFWPQTPPNNLLAVAQRLREPKLHKVFTEVDAVLYGKSEQSVYLLEVDGLMHKSASQYVDSNKNKSEDAVSSLPVL